MDYSIYKEEYYNIVSVDKSCGPCFLVHWFQCRYGNIHSSVIKSYHSITNTWCKVIRLSIS